MENVEKLKFEEYWAEFRLKVCLITHSRTKYFKLSNKMLPKFNFLKSDWELGYVSTEIWDFLNIS